MEIVINPQYENLKDFIEKLPESFTGGGECIYQGRNEIRVFTIDGEPFVVKSFKVPNLLNKIVYAYFRDSKAKRSYHNGMKLAENGVGTPEPVAYIETFRYGCFNQSFYISRFINYPGILRELRTGVFQDQKDLIKAFAHFTAMVHDKDIMHNDYSPGNILYDVVDGTYQFALVDINRMSFGSVGMEAGCYNLRRLWGSDEMIRYLGEEYAETRGFNSQICAELALKYHQEFWERYSKKHSGLKPYIGAF